MGKGFNWATKLAVCPTMFSKHDESLVYDYDGKWNGLLRDPYYADRFCMSGTKPTSDGFKQDCCYHRVRRKYRSRGSADSKIECHYYLATGLDAGIPFNASNEADEKAAWMVARSSFHKIQIHKQYRPSSCGVPLIHESGAGKGTGGA